jgi:hypothetical protein
MILQTILNDLAAILNEGGTNYTVFLRSFEVDPTAPEASEILIREALGAETIVGEIKQVQCASVWPTIEAALTFTGDHNAGPSSAVFSSEVFQTALARTRNQIEGLVAEATGIEVFWLRDGHPDYPVYWDFAFLVRKNAGAMILIGSSSD